MSESMGSYLRKSAQAATEQRRAMFGGGVSESMPNDDEPGLEPWDEDDYADFVQRTAERNQAGAQQARQTGQMKRQYNKTGGAPAEPKQPRQKPPPDPVSQSMKTIRNLRALSNKARGRYPSGKRIR